MYLYVNSLRVCNKPCKYKNFNLLPNHIVGNCRDDDGTNYIFITALQRNKTGWSYKFYMSDRRNYNTDFYREWKVVWIPQNEFICEFIAKFKRKNKIGNVIMTPIEEQLKRNPMRNISRNITSGRKWERNSVFGFAPDNRKGIGAPTEIFTKEEKLYHGFDSMPRMNSYMERKRISK